jgi:ribosomal protein S15P/S13E
MNYYIFIDESGDHGLRNIDPSFPNFALCGIIMSELQYDLLSADFNNIKNHFWKDKKVIFHSRDIRKCEKEFKILLDYETKAAFYHKLDSAIERNQFTIISAIIRKDKYTKKYGKLKSDVYEIALSFIIERVVFFIDSIKTKVDKLFFIIERRGKREDSKLKNHFESIKQIGTYYITPERIKSYNFEITFRDKRANINGLQLADLAAYPIARYISDRERANPAFEIIQPKIYRKGEKLYGLKEFP